MHTLIQICYYKLYNICIFKDDFCDPRYWRFEEVHGRRPEAKVVYY